MRSRRTVIVVALVTVAAAALLLGRSVVRDQVRVAATGAPAPVSTTSPIVAEPGQEVCALDVLLTPETEVAEVVTDQGERPRPPLVFTAAGPGGYSAGPIAVPAGPGQRRPVTARLAPPPRELLGRVCVRNAGEQPVTFVGTEEFRTRTRLVTTVDGEPHPADLTLVFYTGEPVSVLADLPGIVHRATIARGFLGVEALVWLLFGLAFVGVPAALLWTFARALRDDGAARDA